MGKVLSLECAFPRAETSRRRPGQPQNEDEDRSNLEQEHLELLLRASRMLSSSLDLQQVLDTLMDQAGGNSNI